jgi:hypothetical protein
MSSGGGGRPPPGPGSSSGSMRPPTKALGAMTLSSGSGGSGMPSLSAQNSRVSQVSSISQGGEEDAGGSSSGRHKLAKEKDGKKRGLFGRKK